MEMSLCIILLNITQLAHSNRKMVAMRTLNGKENMIYYLVQGSYVLLVDPGVVDSGFSYAFSHSSSETFLKKNCSKSVTLIPEILMISVHVYFILLMEIEMNLESLTERSRKITDPQVGSR